MTLIEESKILPKNYSKVAGVLSVYVKDDENYKPYESPFNSAGKGRILNIEKPDEELKKYDLQMSEKIRGTHHFNTLVEVDVSGTYSSIESSATVSLPYKREYLKIIQKGRHCLLRIFRLPREVDELTVVDKDHSNYIKARNKRKAKQGEYENEMKMILPNVFNFNNPNSNPPANPEANTNNDITAFIHRFAPLNLSEKERGRRSIEGFITNVKLKPNEIEVSIKGWSVVLEGKDIMEFHQMRRSEIVKEVIATAGLHPLVDFTGMPDEIIDWKSSQDQEAPFSASTGDDCIPTGDMSVDKSVNRTTQNGSGKDYDALARIGYAKPGTEYYKWARQFNSVESLAKAFRSKWKYRTYRNNRDNCADQTFNHGNMRGNCWDTSRLFKCCCDAAGFPCVVVGGPGHAWNVIKVGNTWKSWDACYTSTIGKQNSTNAAGF